ncbi:hypothetical protein CBS101457_001036 [Exobasidium rhododendri]|nr:hypothetical protein CBS101457_001036 [Exobasidium rhododendri]
MSASASWSDRVIIALDLDAFYVSAARKRDPSLIGLPVGIKQKGIFATISYEARAKGVKKLATIRDGLALCPDMLLVNGEDLSYFRKISMQVFKLVSSMIESGKVEKLGMDELICDCTEMIEAQMADLELHQTSEADTNIPPVGFILPLETGERVQSHPDRIHRFERQTRMLFLATHLAQRIRSRIAEEVGLTSSAGVATSKLIAKLVGNVHKPNQQTVFASMSLERALPDARFFLDPYPLRSLNGCGSVIVEKMCTFASKSLGHQEEVIPSSQLTVSLARQIFDWQALKDLFGERLGTRLFKLIQGQDDEAVSKAPEYPAQISVEDTYRGLQGQAISDQIFVLSQSLLRRLETELLEPDDADRHKSSAIPEFEYTEKPVIVEQVILPGYKVRDYREKDEEKETSPSFAWKRYPLSVRLSVRQRWHNRVSRQGRMPVEIFDLSTPRRDRARVLAHGLDSVLKAIFASEGYKGQELNLVSIAALDLSPNRPAQAIGGYFRSNAVKAVVAPAFSPSTGADAIDIAFLNALPPEMRAEIAEEYNIVLDQADTADDDTQCEWCGQPQRSWLQHDHARWPDVGLPAGQTDAIDWGSDLDEAEGGTEES